MAPEVQRGHINQTRYDKVIDSWSLGVTLAIMCIRSALSHTDAVADYIIQGVFDASFQGSDEIRAQYVTAAV